MDNENLFINLDDIDDDNVPVGTVMPDEDDIPAGYADDTAFSGGVEPGGLRTTSDIRILICYLLNSVDAPLSTEDILDVCQNKGIANYFEVIDALSGLEERSCIKLIKQDKDLDCYVIEPRGRAIAETLDVAIPLSVREKAVEAATVMLSKAKVERENSVEIIKTEKGYNVTCHISDGEIDLMSFSIYVPDFYQARKVRVNFLRDPARTYRILLASVTRSLDLERNFNNE